MTMRKFLVLPLRGEPMKLMTTPDKQKLQVIALKFLVTGMYLEWILGYQRQP